MNSPYLLNISMMGIKNISKEIKISFYNKGVDKNFNPEDFKVKAIYGENGSGKTGVITAMSILKHLIQEPYYLTQDRTQTLLHALVNKRTNLFNVSVEFLLKVEEDIHIFNYSISINKNENNYFVITEEKLKHKNGNTKSNKWHDIYNVSNGEVSYLCDDEATNNKFINMTTNLLSSSSFISLVISKINETIEPSTILTASLAVFFFSVTCHTYLDQEDKHETYLFNQQKNNNQKELIDDISDYKDNAYKIISEKGKYFVDKEHLVQFEEKIGKLYKFINLFKNDLVSIDIDKREDKDTYVCELYMNYGDYIINSEFESTGIKKLMQLFDILTIASHGGIVFIDELDANINSVYLNKLIEYFMYYSEGQLCFTTHNLDPMLELKESKYAIDILNNDNEIVTWVKKGNSSPDNSFRNGMIKGLPFNVSAIDFTKIFGE